MRTNNHNIRNDELDDQDEVCESATIYCHKVPDNSTFNFYSGYVAYNIINEGENRPIGAGLYIGATSHAVMNGGHFLENYAGSNTFAHGSEIAVHR